MFCGFFLPIPYACFAASVPVLKNSSVRLEVVKAVRIKKHMYLLKGLLQCCPHICSLSTLPTESVLSVSCIFTK